MIHHYFRMAWRNMLKNKAKAMISILGIVAGLFCFTTTNYFGRAIYRGDGAFPEYNRMAKVFLEGDFRMSFLGKTKKPEASAEDIEKVLALGFDEIESIARYNNSDYYGIAFTDENKHADIYRAAVMDINEDFIKVYPNRFIEGSEEQFLKRPDAAIITRSFLSKLNMNESVLGKVFTTKYHSRFRKDSLQTYVIVGIVDDYPLFTSFTLGIHPDILVKNDKGTECTILLRPDANIPLINERMQHITSTEVYDGIIANIFIGMLKDQRQLPLQFGIIGIIGLLVMLSGIINFLILSLGSFINRNHEISLRKVLGGQNSGLFIMLFTELFIIVIISVIVTIAISELFYPFLMSQLSGNLKFLSINIHEAIRHNIEYGLLILLLCAIVSWIFVGHLRLKKSIMDIHRGNATGTKHRLRNVMLAIQLFISIFFLIAVGACIMQYAYNKDEYNNEIRTSETNRNIYINLMGEYMLSKNGNNILQYIRSAKWTEKAGAANSYQVEYVVNGNKKHLLLMNVSPGYAFTDEGKEDIKESLSTGKPFCVVSKSLLDALEEDSIFGYVPGENGKKYPITGILQEDEYLRAYVSFTDELPTRIFIRLRADADVDAVKKELTEYIRNFLPRNYNFEINTQAELYDPFYRIYGLLFSVFGTCAAITMLISILGIYGAITLDTQRRQKEIAIRKINGAEVRNIYWLFGRLYLTLYIVSGTLALLTGWAILSFMHSQPHFFKTIFDYTNPVLWISVMLVSAIVIFLTVYYHIKKVVEINPAEIIKTE